MTARMLSTQHLKHAVHLPVIDVDGAAQTATEASLTGSNPLPREVVSRPVTCDVADDKLLTDDLFLPDNCESAGLTVDCGNH